MLSEPADRKLDAVRGVYPHNECEPKTQFVRLAAGGNRDRNHPSRSCERSRGCCALLTSLGATYGRIGIEAGPLSQWLVNALTAANLR